MPPQYPYRASASMRFKAQDGQFVLSPNAIVTVTGPSDDDGDWVNVTSEDGQTGSVPSGFLTELIGQAPQAAEDLGASSAPSTLELTQLHPTSPIVMPAFPANMDDIKSKPLRSPFEPVAAQGLPSPTAVKPPPLLPGSQPQSISPDVAPTPSSSTPPPPPPSKPSALRDRIAMFNKAPSGPPPPVTGSSRPKPPLARKPLNMPPPIPPVHQSDSNEQASGAAEGEPPQPVAPAGMSAADAEEAVRAGGSLKDRIKLLQQQQQQAGEASAAPPSLAPKPKREWKRPVAAPGTGDDLPPIIGMMPPPLQRLSSKGPDSSDTGNEPSNLSSISDSVPNPSSTITEEAVTEEADDDDVARRRRIAERMAKLGRAQMGFGFPGSSLGAKPPIPSKTKPDLKDLDRSDDAPRTTAPEPALPPERIAMPAMPKKAGPPRRKAPAMTASPPVSNDVALSESSEAFKPEGIVDLTQSHSNDHKAENAVESITDALQSSREQSEPVMEASMGEASVKHAISSLNPANRSLDDENDSPLFLQSEEELKDKSAAASSSIAQEPPETRDASTRPPPIDVSHRQEDSTLLAPIETVDAVYQSSHDTTPAFEVQAPRPSSSPTPKDTLDSEHHHQNEAALASQRTSLKPTAAETYSGEVDEETEKRQPSLRENQIESEAGLQSPITDRPDSIHITDTQMLVRPASITSRPPLPATPGTAPISPGEPHENFAKKMAAIGAQPTFPPGSARGQMRRPSGPRELKSALVDIAAEPSSLMAKPLNDQLSTPETNRKPAFDQEHAPSDALLPPHLGARPLPQAGTSAVLVEEPSHAGSAADDRDEPQSPTHDMDISDPIPLQENSDDVQEAEEDEETSRRRRLAERMAKMGARPMMGGMMPMLPSGPSSGASRRSTVVSSSGNYPISGPTPTNALGPPPPVPSARPLPTVPGATLPLDSGVAPHGQMPSPPRRAAPSPTYPPPSSTLNQATEPPNTSVNQSPPTPAAPPSNLSTMTDLRAKPPTRSPPMPPPPSPGGRPKVPSAYQNVPKRSSVLSQPGLTWAQVEEPSATSPKGSEEVAVDESCDSVASENEDRGPPPIPPQRPPVPALPRGSFASSRKDSNEPARPGSSGSARISDPHVGGPEKDSSHYPTRMLSTTNEVPAGPRKTSHASLKSSYKARDLDLASERWWRTKPVSLPMSVRSMKDVLARVQGSSTLRKGICTYHYELVVIRDDYSKTVVRIYFEEGEDESATEMTQTHYPPPTPYPISTLQELSAAIGPQLVARAKAREDEKGAKFVGAEEDGKLFVGMIIQSVEGALEPVGETFGEVVHKCEIQDFKAAHPEIDVKDDIRPGDVVASYGAAFKGKGIGHNSMNLGTVTNAHVAIVAEHDVKKNKFKAYGIWHGKVELLSYRLDELKSGSIKVFRVLDKQFLER